MADHEHQPDAARRMRDLLYVIRVTEALGENTIPEDGVGGYNQALDDITDAIQGEFEKADLDWRWEKEEHLSQLAARLKSIEELFKSMQGLHPKG
jgi:hypothetical protein